MLKPPKYKARSHDYLEEQLRKVQNKLQLRDWEITLYTDDYPPEKFADDNNCDCSARCEYELQYLTAHVWVSPKRARTDGVDPLFYLYHEAAHIWIVSHNEELRVNTIALLLNTIM